MVKDPALRPCGHCSGRRSPFEYTVALENWGSDNEWIHTQVLAGGPLCVSCLSHLHSVVRGCLPGHGDVILDSLHCDFCEAVLPRSSVTVSVAPIRSPGRSRRQASVQCPGAGSRVAPLSYRLCHPCFDAELGTWLAAAGAAPPARKGVA